MKRFTITFDAKPRKVGEVIDAVKLAVQEALKANIDNGEFEINHATIKIENLRGGK